MTQDIGANVEAIYCNHSSHCVAVGGPGLGGRRNGLRLGAAEETVKMPGARPSGIFVTGTDTGVGKTVVAAAFLLFLRGRGVDVAAMKPFQSGYLVEPPRRRGDAALLARCAGVHEPLHLINPFSFREPLAPAVAAAREGRPTALAPAVAAFRELATKHEFVLVEGVGGLAVPLTVRETVADLATILGLPLLIVSRPGLGAISHCTLTVHYARAKGLTVAGIILSGAQAPPTVAERTNPSAIEATAGVPVLGVLPRVAGRRETVARSLADSEEVWGKVSCAIGVE